RGRQEGNTGADRHRRRPDARLWRHRHRFGRQLRAFRGAGTGAEHGTRRRAHRPRSHEDCRADLRLHQWQRHGGKHRARGVTYSIRRLGPEDVGAYRALRLEALKAAPEAFGTAHEEAAHQSDAYFRNALQRLAVFGAFDAEGTLAGMVAFARREGLKARHVGDIISVYVGPSLRGTGA